MDLGPPARFSTVGRIRLRGGLFLDFAASYFVGGLGQKRGPKFGAFRGRGFRGRLARVSACRRTCDFSWGSSEIRKLGIRQFRLPFLRSRADGDSGPPPLAPEPEVLGFVSSGPRPVSEGSSGRSALKPEGVLLFGVWVRENQLFFAPEPTTAGPGPGAGSPLKISGFPGAWVPRPSKRAGACVQSWRPRFRKMSHARLSCGEIPPIWVEWLGETAFFALPYYSTISRDIP